MDGTWNTPKNRTNVFQIYEERGGLYYPGPGTGESHKWLNKWFGGIFGYGVQNIVDKAYAAYRKNHKPGEPVNLWGFSRGAAAVRMLAQRICDEGGTVDFLGCFDTVGAFGIPVDLFGIPFQKINLFHNMTVHPRVLRAAHAVATDEPRGAFQTTMMKPRQGIIQAGFHLSHSQVGSSLSTKRWMLSQHREAFRPPHRNRKP